MGFSEPADPTETTRRVVLTKRGKEQLRPILKPNSVGSIIGHPYAPKEYGRQDFPVSGGNQDSGIGSFGTKTSWIACDTTSSTILSTGESRKHISVMIGVDQSL